MKIICRLAALCIALAFFASCVAEHSNDHSSSVISGGGAASGSINGQN
jgi:hypothetical protein